MLFGHVARKIVEFLTAVGEPNVLVSSMPVHAPKNIILHPNISLNNILIEQRIAEIHTIDRGIVCNARQRQQSRKQNVPPSRNRASLRDLWIKTMPIS